MFQIICSRCVALDLVDDGSRHGADEQLGVLKFLVTYVLADVVEAALKHAQPQRADVRMVVVNQEQLVTEGLTRGQLMTTEYRLTLMSEQVAAEELTRLQMIWMHASGET